MNTLVKIRRMSKRRLRAACFGSALACASLLLACHDARLEMGNDQDVRQDHNSEGNLGDAATATRDALDAGPIDAVGSDIQAVPRVNNPFEPHAPEQSPDGGFASADDVNVTIRGSTITDESPMGPGSVRDPDTGREPPALDGGMPTQTDDVVDNPQPTPTGDGANPPILPPLADPDAGPDNSTPQQIAVQCDIVSQLADPTSCSIYSTCQDEGTADVNCVAFGAMWICGGTLTVPTDRHLDPAIHFFGDGAESWSVCNAALSVLTSAGTPTTEDCVSQVGCTEDTCQRVDGCGQVAELGAGIEMGIGSFTEVSCDLGADGTQVTCECSGFGDNDGSYRPASGVLADARDLTYDYCSQEQTRPSIIGAACDEPTYSQDGSYACSFSTVCSPTIEYQGVEFGVVQPISGDCEVDPDSALCSCNDGTLLSASFSVDAPAPAVKSCQAAFAVYTGADLVVETEQQCTGDASYQETSPGHCTKGVDCYADATIGTFPATAVYSHRAECSRGTDGTFACTFDAASISPIEAADAADACDEVIAFGTGASSTGD